MIPSSLAIDCRIGAAFALAVADLLCGRYDHLGRATATQPAVFHCPFLMDMIPCLLSMAEEFADPQGAGLPHVRDQAQAWSAARWWLPRPHGSYATFLNAFQEDLDIRDARYLALLAENYAPADRECYAVTRMRKLQQQQILLPDLVLPDSARPFAQVVRRSFLGGYPLVIGTDILLPNHRAGRYDPVRMRSLSRSYMSRPALVIKDGDASLSTLNRIWNR